MHILIDERSAEFANVRCQRLVHVSLVLRRAAFQALRSHLELVQANRCLECRFPSVTLSNWQREEPVHTVPPLSGSLGRAVAVAAAGEDIRRAQEPLCRAPGRVGGAPRGAQATDQTHWWIERPGPSPASLRQRRVLVSRGKRSATSHEGSCPGMRQLSGPIRDFLTVKKKKKDQYW